MFLTELHSFSEDGKEVFKVVEKLWDKFSKQAIKTDRHFWSIPLTAEVGHQKVNISYRNDNIDTLPEDIPNFGVGLHIYVEGSSAINAPEVTCLLYRDEPYVRILMLTTSDLSRQNVIQKILGSELKDQDRSLIVNQIKTAVSGEFKIDPEDK